MSWVSVFMIVVGAVFGFLGVWQARHPEWAAKTNMGLRPWSRRTLADYRRDAVIGGWGGAVGGVLFVIIGVVILMTELV